MRELACNPLVLSLLLEELRHRGDKAAKQLGPLFANYSYRMLDSAKATPVEDKKALLARLAFAMKQDQVHEYDLDRTLDVIAREPTEARLEQTPAQEILDDLIGSSLLRTGSTGRVAFSHPYCQDYFASVALEENYTGGNVDWQAVAKKYEWREAIFFLVSTVERPKALIGQLSDHDPLLAAECMLEVECVDDELRGQIAKAVANRGKTGTQREKTRATELLTELGLGDIASDVAPYRHVVDYGIVKDSERTTTATIHLGTGHLVVQKGPLAGQHIVLFEGTACLGRSSKADVEMSDPSVSRRHAEISVAGEDIRIRDLRSTNGTWVNGKQITTWRQLRDGDEIQLGDLLLVLHIAHR
jgi:hypothetical protein